MQLLALHNKDDLYFLLHHGVNRDACTSGPSTKEQANEHVLTIARFVNACSTEQIRLAPEKCMFAYYFNLVMLTYMHGTYYD